jgi:hypothetical protein
LRNFSISALLFFHWDSLSQTLSLREKAQHISKLPFRKRRLYYKLNKEANWLKQCYLNSIIHKGLAYIGGVETDVSGDRVRVFIGKTYEDYQYKDLGKVKYVIKKRFFSIKEYERMKCWLLPNYKKYAPLYKESKLIF